MKKKVYIYSALLTLSLLVTGTSFWFIESKLLFSLICATTIGVTFSLYIREYFYAIINAIILFGLPFIYHELININHIWVYVISMITSSIGCILFFRIFFKVM